MRTVRHQFLGTQDRFAKKPTIEDQETGVGMSQLASLTESKVVDPSNAPVKWISGRWVWSVSESWRDVIQANADRIRWDDLGAEDAAQLIKTGQLRQMWRLRNRSLDIFVKQHKSNGFFVRLKRRFLGAGGRQEWDVARYAMKWGVPTAAPIAFAEGAIGSTVNSSMLLTAAIPNAVPLPDYWLELQTSPSLSHIDRRDRILGLIDQTSRLLASAHQSGLYHRDLHAANIVVQPATERDIGGVFLIDLHGARIERPVRGREVVRNLVQLNQWFHQHASVAVRMRFLRQYLQRRTEFSGATPYSTEFSDGLKSLATVVRLQTVGHARHLFRKRDRRAISDSRYFHHVEVGNRWRGHVLLHSKHPANWSPASQITFALADWERILSRPLDWVAPERVDIVKDGKSATVCRAPISLNGDSISVYVKHPLRRKWYNAIVDCFRPSRSLRAWKKANQLINRGMPTATPLAVLERRLGPYLSDNMLFLESIPDSQDLDTLLRTRINRLSSLLQRKAKDALVSELTWLLRRMHGHGFVHRDLKATNLLVQWTEDRHDRPRLYLIDLDGLKLPRWTSRSDRMRSLMRLNVALGDCRAVTRTDRLRLLLGYLARIGGGRPEWKPAWRELAESSARKHQRARRVLGRRLGAARSTHWSWPTPSDSVTSDAS